MKEVIENTGVINNEKDHRFEIKLKDKRAFVLYNFKDDMIGLFHVEVPEEFSAKDFGQSSQCMRSTMREIIISNFTILPFVQNNQRAPWVDTVCKTFPVRANH